MNTRKSFIIKTIVILLMILGIAQLPRCTAIRPEDESDSNVRMLEEVDISIQTGLPYAIDRVSEWRDTMHLNYINAGFTGKEQIKTRKGRIIYFFDEMYATQNLNASAQVRIDMANHCIYEFIGTYGTSRELVGGDKVLHTEEWIIDINEAFDIALAEIGEDKIYQYDNPKVVLRCGETMWDFCVYPSPDSSYADIEVTINPATEEIISVWYRKTE